ncbi:MAG: HAD-IA family hydrolase, partial [Myxococcota bacterium]
DLDRFSEVWGVSLATDAIADTQTALSIEGGSLSYFSGSPNDGGRLLMVSSIPVTSIGDLVEKYEAILLDAYGVLIDGQGALAGAPEMIAALNTQKFPYWVVTNDASRLPSSASKRYGALGLNIDKERIITAGSLLSGHFSQNGWQGKPCLVIGPPDSAAYVRNAGGEVIDWEDKDQSRAEALIIGDEGGYDFIPRVNLALSAVFARLDTGADMHFVLPNPDLIYPAAPGRFGFTAGSIALWFEAALAHRYPDRPPITFERLGKPYAAIYKNAVDRAGTSNVVMVGDQIETDIRGARAIGLDAALVTFGLTRKDIDRLSDDRRPTYLLHDWSI